MAPAAAPTSGSEIDTEYVENLTREFTGPTLALALQAAQLPHSGNKGQQARRIALNSPVHTRTSRPTRPQIVYMAAASPRQGLLPAIEILQDKGAAQRWLTLHGDYRR